MGTKPAVWSIQAKGEAECPFLTTGHIAMGWPKIGDLSYLEASREAFKTKLIACYLDRNPRLMPIYASELFQFVHRIAIADIMVYPSTFNRKIYMGQVKGPYKYDPTLSQPYPNLYPVKWLASLLDTQFTRKTLREIRSPMTLFRIKNIAATEVLALLETRAD